MCKNIFYKDCCDKFIDYVKKQHNVEENEPKLEKTTQDVQKNCLSLTEQFFDDEIDESKLYYFKQKMSEEIEIGHPFSLNMVRAMDDTYLDWFLIDKVLAPVPSYEQWEKLNWYAGNGVEENQELKMENAKLKELLKECREVAEFTKTIVNKHKWFNEVITKIDKVLK